MTRHQAPRREALSITGPAGVIEALIEVPEQVAVTRIAIICHPHPLHHGSMHNKVVHTVARAMLDLGAAALRFNFRGVGASDGRYDEGIGEADDAGAVCAWLRERYPGAALTLAGFSFGAAVACRAALAVQPQALIAIAPPVSRVRKLLDGRLPDTRWLVIQGDADGVVPSHEVADWAAEIGSAVELLLLPGVDHFFHGNLTLLRQTLVERLGGQTAAGASPP